MISPDELKNLREAHQGCVIVLDDGARCHAQGDDCAAVENSCKLRAVPCVKSPEGDVVTFGRDALAVVIAGLAEDGHKVVQCGMAKEAEQAGGPVPPPAGPIPVGAKPQPPPDAAPVPATEAKPESSAGVRPAVAAGAAPIPAPGAPPAPAPGPAAPAPGANPAPDGGPEPAAGAGPVTKTGAKSRSKPDPKATRGDEGDKSEE